MTLREANRIFLPLTIGVLILGAIFGSLGVLLVYLGVKGDTHFVLFGQSMSTTDSGVASIFIGAITVILVVRRILKAVEHTVSVRGKPKF